VVLAGARWREHSGAGLSAGAGEARQYRSAVPKVL